MNQVFPRIKRKPNPFHSFDKKQIKRQDAFRWHDTKMRP